MLEKQIRFRLDVIRKDSKMLEKKKIYGIFLGKRIVGNNLYEYMLS